MQYHHHMKVMAWGTLLHEIPSCSPIQQPQAPIIAELTWSAEGDPPADSPEQYWPPQCGLVTVRMSF